MGKTRTSFARLLPARASSPKPSWTSSVCGLLRVKGKRCPLPPVAPPALPPKKSTWACYFRPARTGLRCFFFVRNRAEVHEACGSQGPVSWVAAASSRRLGATAQEAQSGAARPQWEHVGLDYEFLLRDDPGTFVVLPLRGAAAPDPRPRMRLRRKTSVSQLQDAHPRACRDVRRGCPP